jgi:glycerol-3-phosphate dehydrogenase (NAD(P)+)
MQPTSIGVLGAGSWGTALAKHLSDIGHPVTLWARRRDQAESMQKTRENSQYLPGHRFADALSVTNSLEEALSNKTMVLSVVPSQMTRQVWMEARGFLPAGVPVLGASKGIEVGTLQLVNQILEDVLPNHPTAFIAGPSFAKEVAMHLPTAVVVAAQDTALVSEVQGLMSSDWLRAYGTRDVVGVEVGGALKNIMAIACGTADGLGFGANTRAAIITRGLAEITRMAIKLGAEPATLAGLGGVGDLVLTCTGDLSRNRRVGLGLGQGKKLPQILAEMGQVAEGVETTRSAKELAEREGVDVPITLEVYDLLFADKSPKESVLDLMRRGLKSEQA